MEDVTQDQIKSLRQKFEDKIQAKNADFCACDVQRVKTDDTWMRRFIAHTEFDVDAACDMLFDACQWRKEFGTNELTEKSMPSHLFDKGVLFIRNKDVFGKNLLIFKAKFHSKGVEDLENIRKFIVYYFERIERVSKSEQISVIFDMEDTGMNNMDMDFIRYLITLLKTYYPYFINYLLIYEMPWLLNAAWKIIKGWLPPKFVDRVKFVSKKNIKEYIDVDNQLASWGGKDNYKYTFEPEVLPAPARALPAVSNGNIPNNNRTSPSHNVQNRKENLQLPGIDEPGAADDHLFRTAQTPSPRTAFAEPIRRMNMDSHDGPHLVEVTDRIVLTKDNAERISGRFQIRNVAPSNEAVLFKIKTTAPEKFHVRPTLGLLEASATGNVSISVNLGSNLRSIGHERFQVQVIIAPKDLLDGINGNGQAADGSLEFHGDLSRVWKKIASKETRIENHRIGCTLDSSISEAMISPSGANLVTMNEDEMRKGLKQIETRIVDSIQSEMVKKFSRIERLVYFVLGLLVLLLASSFWSSSSNSEQHCHKP